MKNFSKILMGVAFGSTIKGFKTLPKLEVKILLERF
jgi:hypothetical protein